MEEKDVQICLCVTVAQENGFGERRNTGSRVKPLVVGSK